MTSGTRLTLHSATATCLVSLSLSPLAEPRPWLAHGIFCTWLVAGVSAVGRRFRLVRPLIAALQLVVVLLLLTVVFAGDEAVGGILPGPDAFHTLAGDVSSGVRDASQYSAPAPATDGIGLLLVTGIGVVAVAVDLLAVGYRLAALAGLPLLAMYSVATALHVDGSSWPWFLLAGFGYLLLLRAEGRHRFAVWGRVLGGRGQRTSGGGVEGDTSPQVRSGRRIGLVALGLALFVPQLVPDLGPGLWGASPPGGAHGAGPGTISAVNPLVDLQDSLNQSQDRTVLRYRTDAPNASSLYLRIVALDKYNGVSWKPSEQRVEKIDGPFPEPEGLDRDTTRRSVKTTVAATANYRQGWLPMPYPASRVNAPGRWRFEPAGRAVVGEHGQTTASVTYQVTSYDVHPTRAQLRNAQPPPKRISEKYTRLPRSVSPSVLHAAKKVTAGSESDYAKAVALQRWFADSGAFTYDTTASSGTGAGAMARFLKNKQGYCEHYASTMAVMARALHIPARVAVGFVPGTEQGDGTFRVGLRDAHAWPELYFEGVGWVRFEPTPSRGYEPSYTTRRLPGMHGPAPGAPRQRASTPSGRGSSAPRCTDESGDCGATHAATGPKGEASGGRAVLAPVLASGAAAVLLLLAAPMLLRLRARRRRFAPRTGDATRGTGSGTVPGRQAGSGWTGSAHPAALEPTAGRTLRLWHELLDSAWDLGMPPAASDTPRRVTSRLVWEGELDETAGQAAWRIAEATERALYAGPGRQADVDVDALTAEVRTVRRALAVHAGRRAQLRALLLPRSSVRLLWTAADRLRGWGRRSRAGRPLTRKARDTSRL